MSAIRIVVSEESLFEGVDDMSPYNASESHKAYAEALEKALVAEFACDVEVTQGIMDRIALDDDNQEDRPYVDQIIGTVFESYEWVRYR